LIRRLLGDALAAWAASDHQADAALVRRLFFAPLGTPLKRRRPDWLLHEAHQASDRQMDDFDKHGGRRSGCSPAS
jgi:hypothetical protein